MTLSAFDLYVRYIRNINTDSPKLSKINTDSPKLSKINTDSRKYYQHVNFI